MLFLGKNKHIKGVSWWLSGKEPAYQCRKLGFDTWVRKIPWTGKWQPTPLFLPGKPMVRRAEKAKVHSIPKELGMT